jgi:hypothetical protein
MDHQFKEDRKTVPILKNSSISPRKSISGTYLIFIASLLGDEQCLSMGEEVGTMQFLEFKVEQLKKFKGVQIKKSKLRCESLVTECMTKKLNE